MSKIFYLWISPHELHKLSLGRHRIWYKGTLMLSIASCFEVRNPPPAAGGLLFGRFPNQKHQKIKNQEDPPRRICTKCFEGGLLSPGSWLGICHIGEPPGGGISCDQVGRRIWKRTKARKHKHNATQLVCNLPHPWVNKTRSLYF